MQAAHLASFGFWFLTVFSLVGIALKYEPIQPDAIPAFAPRQGQAFEAENIRYLFHFSDSRVDQPVIQATSEQIKLLGILHANQPQGSRAIVQGHNKKVSAYAINEKLPNGSRLVKIEKRLIVLENNGVHEQMRLAK